MAGFAAHASEVKHGFRTAPPCVIAVEEPDRHEEDDAMKLSRWIACGLLAALLAAFALPAAASAQAALEPEEEWDVIFSGVLVMRVRFGLGGLSSLERQHLIYQRLRDAVDTLGPDLSPDLVQVTEADGQVFLQLGPHVIATVDEAHARYQQSTPRGLAEVWAANLRRAVERYVALQYNG